MPVLKSEQIFVFVERLTENIQYTVVGVERLLGPIGLQKSSEYSDDYFEIYEARCDDSTWLKYVELGAPTANHPSGGRLLILDFKAGVGREVGLEEVVLQYGEEDEFEILPEAPPEEPYGLLYSRSWGQIYFGVTRDFEELVTITIHVD